MDRSDIFDSMSTILDSVSTEEVDDAIARVKKLQKERELDDAIVECRKVIGMAHENQLYPNPHCGLVRNVG